MSRGALGGQRGCSRLSIQPYLHPRSKPCIFSSFKGRTFCKSQPKPTPAPRTAPRPSVAPAGCAPVAIPTCPCVPGSFGELGEVLVAFSSHGMGSHHTLIARWLRMEAFRSLLQLAAAAITLGFPLFHLPLLLSHLLGFIPSPMLSSSSSEGHMGTPKSPAAGQGSWAGVSAQGHAP